jgi:D-psicose/D-tagatose/L-ribulose 3-epimerase
MKLGINTFLFASPFTTQRLGLLREFKEMGFDGVEIAFEKEGDLDYGTTLKALEDNGLKCCSLCGAFGKGRDLRGTPEEQATAKEFIKTAIRACRALQCDVLAGPVYSTVGRARMETPEAQKRQWDTVVANLKEMCRYGEEHGVHIAVEVMNRFATDFLNTCRDALRLVDAVDSRMLGLHLDTFHMNIEEKSLANAILDAGPRLLDFHVADNDRGTPGTGTIDWKAVRDALLRIGYDRYVVIESFVPQVLINGSVASIWRPVAGSNYELAGNGVRFLKALFQE